MANSACVTINSPPKAKPNSRFHEVRWDWLSDDGDGTVTFANTPAAKLGVGGVDSTDPPVSGVVLRCICIPDIGGTQPDDLYDVSIIDKDGIDILHGNGANRNHDAPDDCVGFVSANALVAIQNTSLELRIAGAGNANGGNVTLYISQ